MTLQTHFLLDPTVFTADNFEFQILGMQHWVPILSFALFGVLLIRWSQKQSEKVQIQVGILFASGLSLVLIGWTLMKIYLNGFNIKTDLPLHLCNIISLFLPVFALVRKNWMYEILLFWVFAGTTQAMITPDLVHGFPHYNYLKYWIVHAGLVVFMFYATLVYGMRPNVCSIFKSFFALQIYFVAMLLVNKLLGSNYFFISEKPPHGSLLDYFGEWPYYILVAELIVFPYFFIIYLPFHLSRKRVISQKADLSS